MNKEECKHCKSRREIAEINNKLAKYNEQLKHQLEVSEQKRLKTIELIKDYTYEEYEEDGTKYETIYIETYKLLEKLEFIDCEEK